MTRRLTAWLGWTLALAGTAWAQESSSGGGPDTVKKEDVKTWIVSVDGKEYEDRPLTPSYDGSTGLFHMSSAFSLPKGKFSFQLFRDNLDRDPKDLDASIHGLSLAYGAGRGLEIFGNIGVQNRVNTDAPLQLGFPNDFPFAGQSTSSPGWQTGFGDIKLGAKYQFLNGWGSSHNAGGLAVRGYVKLPTADDQKGLGTGKASFGADLIASVSPGNVVDLHASLGYQINSDPDDVDIGNAFKWAIGAGIPCCRIFQLQAELMGTNYGDSDFDQTNPLDLVVGPVFWIKTGWFIRPAISWNLNFDDRGLNSSSSSWTGRQISIGYHPGSTCREVYTPPPPAPPPANRAPTVACQVEKSSLIPGETARCRATGSDPDGDPLTYEWSASAGKVTGSGAEGTFDSAGIAGPTTVTLTVKVSDGRGGTASANCTVRVEEPRKPETVTCTSGGFPRNLARLNNVDKACLDDVATRLRQDPKSRVVIVGHADSKERYPEVIGRTRAEAVKAYLVKERGVDESRVIAKSAGATRPLDTGTSAAARAKNRRVELVFVPEGATPPEDDD
jgi:outer membrane protein OmpA-like peptidoglycan-associated protein